MILPDDEHARATGGQTRSELRSRILLGLLAIEEAERLGLSLSHAKLEQTTRWFRTSFGLELRQDMEAFMRFAGLDRRELTAQMRIFCAIAEVQDHHAALIETSLGRYRAVIGARDWALERERDA